MEKKVVLLTGASSGIGYQTAEYLAKQGHIVYGAARRMEKMEPLREFGVKPIRLDVTSEESVSEVVETIIKTEGHIDVLVNNAGYGSYGAVEDVSIGEARKQFDVNIFGVATLTKKVLPYMRARHSGTIVNVTSIGGRLTTYFGAWYHATKYALEALSDALRMETKPFGINVSIIEPGGIKTPWGFIAADHLAESAKGGAYEERAAATAVGMRKQYEGNMMSGPIVIAKAISRAVNSHRPRTRYTVGFMAKPLVWLHAWLPARWFDYMMMHAS